MVRVVRMMRRVRRMLRHNRAVSLLPNDQAKQVFTHRIHNVRSRTGRWLAELLPRGRLIRCGFRVVDRHER
jgi:hypothetical protein